MIDVVFQLMIFFMLTFNIIAPEGDFDVRMPLGKSSAEPPDELQLPPIQVRLAADDEGTLAGISMNGEPVLDFGDLRQRVANFVDIALESGASLEDIELEIAPFVLDIFKDAKEKFGSRAWSSMVVKRLEDKYGISFREKGFPDELVDNEPEEKGQEV